MPGPRRVIWSPAAEQDLVDIWAYYARVASPEIADRLLREIDQVGTALTEHPLSSRDRGALMPGLRSALARPQVIFFRIKDDDVEIARVLHGRRDFPAIFSGQE
jgi:toxin ParE1/3/4